MYKFLDPMCLTYFPNIGENTMSVMNNELKTFKNEFLIKKRGNFFSKTTLNPPFQFE